MGYRKIVKLTLIIPFLLFLFVPFSARAEYCFWSPTMNNSPKPGEDTCNKPGETTFIMDSTASSCKGQPKNPTFDKICCCQIADRPGQCTVNANACAAGENCVNGWCEGKKVKLIDPLTQLQVLIPGLDKIAQEFPASCTTTDAKTNCTLPWIAIYIKALYNYALGIVGILAAIALMIGGVIWLVSAGNATRISQAQSWIIGSLTGLLIMVTSYILLNQINPDLVGLKPVTLKIIEEILPDTTDAVSGSALDPSTWVSIPQNSNICPNSVRANQAIVDKITAAANCMAKKGLKIEIGGGSRTVQRQAEIYDERYIHPANQCNKQGLKKGLAPACCPYPLGVQICPHTSGSAFDLRAVTTCGKMEKDLSNQYILQDCMQEAGAYLLDAECWHFESPKISPYSKSQVGNHNSRYCEDWPK